MKARAVRFTPEAAAQAEAAERWWRQNRAGSADLFANELRSAVDLVVRAPGAGRGYLSEALPGARRVPLHRTRFHIYYVQREDVVVVVAVWSAVRGEGPPLVSLGSSR